MISKVWNYIFGESVETRIGRFCSVRKELQKQIQDIRPDIDKLFMEEKRAFDRGVQEKDSRRYWANKLSNIRSDIKQQTNLESIIRRQINVIDAHLANMTIQANIQLAALPNSDELVQTAADAEAQVECLTDLCDTAKTANITLPSETEELAIMKEFEEASSTTKPQKQMLADASDHHGEDVLQYLVDRDIERNRARVGESA